MEAGDKHNKPTVLSSSSSVEAVPESVVAAGAAARFAWDEFFYGEVRNTHTRRAYRNAVLRFIAWCDQQGIVLQKVTPKAVGQYLDQHPGSIGTRKLHLAAIRRLYDRLVNRHIVILNPAASVRGPRYETVEGKTPEITVEQARALLRSIDSSHVVGLRDRAVIAILIYTAARVGALAKLRLKDFYHAGDQWMLHFDDKGGKSREIPVRHDLQGFLFEYLDRAGIRNDTADQPLLRTAVRKEKRLTANGVSANDLERMVKRRMADAGLPKRLSCHSFRVASLTNLLEQGVPIEDVQHLAGHSDPRTTRLYDRRQRKVTRNVVERISI